MKLFNFVTTILVFVSSSVPSLAGDLTIVYGQRFADRNCCLVPWAISARFLDRATLGRAVITICYEPAL